MNDEQLDPALELGGWIRSVVDLDHDAEALHFEGTWRTWGWIAAAVTALEEWMERGGMASGVRIGVVMRNRPELIRTVAATLATRSCLVTLSSAIPMAKLALEVEQMRLPIVIATEADWSDEQFVTAVRAAGSLGLAATEDDAAFRVAVEGGDRGPTAVDTSPAVAVEMLTSGTTGPPKRIDLSYRGIEHEIVSTARYSESGLGEPRLSSGTSLLWNPILHIGGLRGLIAALVAGRKVALLERFSVSAWADMVRLHQPRAIALVPAALLMVLDADLPRETFEGVKALFCGTAPLDPAMGREFEERYGVPVLVVYGATEFAGGVAGWTIEDRKTFGGSKSGSVGRPNSGVEVRVVAEESGTELSRGDVGLLEVRAAQLGQPGWLRTTDLARMDDDDFIWIAGRADDVIVRGGFKVATNAVRDVIASHPSVLEASVFGVDDRRLGQVPVAAVELRMDAKPVAADELMAFAREQLSGYQVPVEIRILDELPRTPSMKVSQAQLRTMFEQHDS